MVINPKVLYETFVADFYETNKSHLKELENLADEFVKKFKSNKTNYINAYINLLSNQLVEKVSRFIDSLFATIDLSTQLDEKFRGESVKLIETFMAEEYHNGKKMLKAVMASLAMEHDGISAVYIGEYSTKHEQITQLAQSKLKYFITKHNLNSNLH